MCDMLHAIPLLEGTQCCSARHAMPAAAAAAVFPLTLGSAMLYRNTCACAAAAVGAAGAAGTSAARKMDKSNIVSLVKGGMESDMSHLILKDGATLSYI